MHGLLALLVLISVPTQAGGRPPEAARTEEAEEGSPASLADLVGRWVVLTARDGRVLRARLLAVRADALRIQLPNTAKAWVPRAVLAEIAPAGQEGGTATRGRAGTRAPSAWEMPPSDSPRRGRVGGVARCRSTSACVCRPRPRGYVERRSFWVEWIGLRTHIGYLVDQEPFHGGSDPTASLELTLFGLHWRHVYWEILRGGGGYGLTGYWGTALGIPIRLHPNGRHELRVGVHLTLLYGYWPGGSGGYVAYHYRYKKNFSLHIGVMQYSYPTGVSLVMGVSM